MWRQLMLVLLLLPLLVSVSTATKVKTSLPPLVEELEEEHDKEDSATLPSNAVSSPTTAATTTTIAVMTEPTEKCRWGEHCSSSPSSTPNNNNDNNTSHHDSSIQQQPQQQNSQQQHQQHYQIPFVKSKQQYVPPEGFIVTARVYTNITTKLAHFDTVTTTSTTGTNSMSSSNNNYNKHMMIPFINCASTGITTAPLQVRYAYFRHTVWSRPHDVFENAGPDGGAILLVTLADSITLELNSGETQAFGPGSVILLQDNGAGGHKCYSNPPGKDVTVLFMALPKSFRWQLPPPPSHTDDSSVKNSRNTMDTMQATQNAAAHEKKRKEEQLYYCLQQQPPNRGLRVAFSGMGIAITLLLADWWGKVAPIWLSVGIGGGCLVVGGTIGFVKMAESLLEQWYVYRDQQQSSLLWMTQRTTSATPTTATSATSTETTIMAQNTDALQDDNDNHKNKKNKRSFPV